MSLSIVNNTASLTAQTNLGKTSSMLSKSLEKLSTGLKVNRGADGPAALVISEKQRAQIAGLQTAIDNTNKAVSLVQTGDGALNEINSLLTKVRSLAVDSANSGVNDKDSLAANQSEIRNALDTITNIANTTQFGSKRLLDGSAGVQVNSAPAGVSVSGTGSAGAATGTYSLTVNAAAVRANASGATTALTGSQSATLTVNGVGINLNSDNAGSQKDLINTVNQYSGQTGVKASVDNTTGNTVLASADYGSAGNFTVNATGPNAAAVSALAGTTANGVDANIDVSFGANTVAGVVGKGNSISALGLNFSLGDDSATAFTSVGSGGSITAAAVNVTNNSLTFQIGANAGQTATVAFADSRAASLGQAVSGSQFSTLDGIDVTTSSGAQDSIRVIDKAISDIANQRGSLGAFQANTLESNVNNLQASLVNSKAAESVIRDTDFASEIANFTKLQTQMQAGATVLGNANQMTSLVATLLRG